ERRWIPWPRFTARLVLRRAQALAGVSLRFPRPIDTAPTIAVPTLVVHGESDSLIDTSAVRSFADAFGGATTLLGVPGAGHTDVLDVGGPTVVERIAAFLDQTVPLQPLS